MSLTLALLPSLAQKFKKKTPISQYASPREREEWKTQIQIQPQTCNGKTKMETLILKFFGGKRIDIVIVLKKEHRSK
jgi:hypothetical protein